MASVPHTPTRAGHTKVAPIDAPDINNRDPNRINSHIVVDYYSIVGEPEGSRSIAFVWECSEICYSCFYGCLYKLVTLFCGVCIAAKWGCAFAPVQCVNIWIFTPCSVVFRHVCAIWCRGICYSFINCCFQPCFVACGTIFHHFGNGRKYEMDSPRLLPKSRRVPMKEPVAKKEPEPEAVVVMKSPTPENGFNDYDKEKIARSIRRQMML